MTRAVGIDDLNIDGGTLAIDLDAIAAARGIPDRHLQAVGFARRSVIPPYEDPVTLAVNAARPLVEAAGRDAFELVIVATESGLDYGKPISTYVHHHLGLAARCRNLEVKHACYGGTAAIQLAASWVRSADAPGKKALVVMTDVARCHFGDLAEITAGCGAVAVAIGSDPSILEIEPGSGYVCREVYDVARPTATAEWGDPVLSLAAYLDLLEAAWESYRQGSGGTDPVDERFEHMLYHTPLVSLVQQAHAVLLQADRDDVDAAATTRSFDRMVGPALGYARELANIYSGSVYGLLAGLIDAATAMSPGARIGIFSYGSGSCAEIYGGRIAADARTRVGRHDLRRHLESRTRLDLEQYERCVREADAVSLSGDYKPSHDFVRDLFEQHYRGRQRLVLDRIENHHREYVWA